MRRYGERVWKEVLRSETELEWVLNRVPSETIGFNLSSDN
jgi:hypothetical protein